MQELELKYGTNPDQKPARIFMRDGELPVEVMNGRPGYINFLDALNSWALVRELSAATGMASAASFKHVSPAGAAVGFPLTELERRIYFVPETDAVSPAAAAYARARGADRVSSYGDWAALSEVCDEDTARVLKLDFSDGVIAPGYTREALEILRTKRKGAYNIVRIDKDFIPHETERRDVFGITFEQGRSAARIDEKLLDNIVTANKTLPDAAKFDLITALITLKYTQSNSVAFAKNGGAIGVGAGQQSRIHCTRLAASKADNWLLRQHPKVLELPFLDDAARVSRDNAVDLYISADFMDILGGDNWRNVFSTRPEPLTDDEKHDWLSRADGVSLASDAFFPFADNIERACKSGVRYIAQPGGSVRDGEVIKACDDKNIVMAFTGVRLFHH